MTGIKVAPLPLGEANLKDVVDMRMFALAVAQTTKTTTKKTTAGV